MKDNGMKRDCKIPWRWLVFAILVLLLPAQGCGGGNEEEQGEVISVYYINKLETRITAVERVLESSQVEERVEEVLEALAENPVELSLRTPVSGFEIKSWKLQETQLSLDVSEEYKKIPATTEVLVRAALVRSLTQIPGVDHVEMTVNGEALTDSLGSVVGPMTADMFIDNAGNEINAYEKTRIKLYFANERWAGGEPGNPDIQHKYLHGKAGGGAAGGGPGRGQPGFLSGAQPQYPGARRYRQGRHLLRQFR